MEFLIRSGRALVYPIYNETHERRSPSGVSGEKASRTAAVRTVAIMATSPGGVSRNAGPEALPIHLLVSRC